MTPELTTHGHGRGLTPHEERVAIARAVCELADALEHGELPAERPGISTARNIVALAEAGYYRDDWDRLPEPPKRPKQPPKPPRDAHQLEPDPPPAPGPAPLTAGMLTNALIDAQEGGEL